MFLNIYYELFHGCWVYCSQCHPTCCPSKHILHKCIHHGQWQLLLEARSNISMLDMVKVVIIYLPSFIIEKASVICSTPTNSNKLVGYSSSIYICIQLTRLPIVQVLIYFYLYMQSQI
jgi:hypothetical protein